MRLTLDDDQEFFHETTARFLADKAPISVVRALRDDPAGFDTGYWAQGAALGWTSLLVSEADGGGTVSGDGLVDLSLVAYGFGRTAAPGPLLPTAVVAGALSVGGGHAPALKELLAGTAIASWADGEAPPHHAFGHIATEVRVDGDELVVTGVKRPVEAAEVASHLLVTGTTGAGVTQVLVPADAPGMSITPMHGVDLTRRFSVVQLDGVRLGPDAAVGAVGEGAGAVARQRLQAITIANAESVGAMQTAFDLTLEWVFDRYSFGRPLASYQAIKHRFADMTTWLHGSHALCDEAAAAVAAGAPEAATLTSAAKAYVGELGSELVQECVQFHGGIGVTYEHDLHLYLRRHTVNRALHGTPAEHRRLVGDHVVGSQGT